MITPPAVACLVALIVAAIVGVRWRVRQVRRWRHEVDEAFPPADWADIEARPD